MKLRLILWLLPLAVFGQSQVRVLNTLEDLDGWRPSSNQPVVRVLGKVSVGDWGPAREYRYDATSTQATSLVCRAALAPFPGRWVFDWNGDVRLFGVVPEDSSKDASNSYAMDEAVSVASTTGAELRFPAGRTYLSRPIDCLGTVHTVSGSGVIGDPVETQIIVTAQNTSAITNLPTGGRVSRMHLRSKYYAWGKTATNGWAVYGKDGAAAQVLEELYIQGFYGGVRLSTFDSTMRNVDIIAKKPVVLTGGGTQNLLSRVAVRGNLFVTSPTNDTSVTCSSYSAGSTNLVLSDTSNVSVGDYIRVRSSTEYPNTISYRFFPRKVTGVSGNTVTLNYPWPLAFSNGLFEFALGKGGSAIEGLTEGVLQAVNAEWGSWDHIYSPNSGPTASSTISGLHVEGWVCDAGAGANNYVFNGVNTSISASHVDMANVVAFDTDGPTVFEGGTRGYIDVLHLRDFDLYQANPTVWVARTLTRTYSQPVVVRSINNAGVPVTHSTSDGSQWRNTVSDFQFGQEGKIVRVDGTGQGVATWFGYTDTPVAGNFLQNDLIVTPSERLRVLQTGSFQTAAGSNRMFSGSSVLLVDQAARAVLGRRTPVAFSVTNGASISTNHLVVREQLRNSPDTNALTVSAPSGSRMIRVADNSGIQQGDPGVIVEGTNFNDVTVSRVAGTTFVFLSSALTNSFTTNAVFYTGVQMFSVSTNDVHWQAVKFSPPTFVKELDYLNRQRVGGTGVGTALTVEGGTGGVPLLQLERPGAGTNSFLVGDGQVRIRNNADSRQIASFTPSGSDHYWTVGDSTAQASPRRAIIQSEAASGTNVAAQPLILRAGQGTGSSSPTNKVAISVPVATNASPTGLQSAVDIATFQPPPSPGTNQSVLRMYFWTGSAWAERQIWSTNIGGVNYLVHP